MGKCLKRTGQVKYFDNVIMTPTCTLTATLHARPEKRAELMELLSSFVARSRAEPGCVDYHFHASEDDPNVFYFYENWQTRQDLDVHLELPYQKSWFARHDEFLSKPVELKFFRMLSEYDKG